MTAIQNIYYMLSYAFRVLREQGYKKLATEEFDNVADLAAAILAAAVALQIKRGLSREYIAQKESLSTLRGKLELSDSIKALTMQKKRMICSYDEFSVDSYMNRIIKTTMNQLLRADIKKERKTALRKVLIFFDDVGTLDLQTINWNVQYNRNNQTYRMLLTICRLVSKGLLQTEKEGPVLLMDFLDDQLMSTLYERFILEYYRTEFPELNASAPGISWAVDDGFNSMLPDMWTDVTLSHNDRVLIIDAKYYSSIVQSHYDHQTWRSNNLYQIFAYVKNKQLEDKTKSVSGMLLYAGTDEAIQPDHTYQMSGNQIVVQTLDLNCDFSKISGQLNKIAEDFFGVRKKAA